MNKEAEIKLEKLQNLMFRNLFGVPESTPKPLLRFDLGSLSVSEKIHIKKMNFLYHLKTLDSKSLASEFYELQVKLNFPGLVVECRRLLNLYGLPNIIDEKVNFSKECWKKLVKKAVMAKSEETIKKEMIEYSKLRQIGTSSENLELKDYIKRMSLRNARMNFAIRSYMTDCKMNRKSDKAYAEKLWKCDYCKNLDSQSHILWCPAFSPLREGKSLSNDQDLVEYFKNVMKIRENQLT